MPVHRWIFDVPSGWQTAANTRSRRSPARRWSGSGWLMLNVPSSEAIVIPRASASRRIRVTSSGGISSGIAGRPAQPMLSCPQSSPQAFMASNRASNVGRENVPIRMPICISGAAESSGSAAACKVGAHVAPSVRAPAALSQCRRVQRSPLSEIAWSIKHRYGFG